MRAVWLVLAVVLGVASPLAAREEEDVCPGTYTGREHPACPPAETLAWIDCPPRWPADPTKVFRFAPLFYEFAFDWPDVERHNLERHPEGAQLFCEYGPGDERQRYQLIIEVPGPISQWGWHDTPGGRIVGCRVPKALAAKPAVTHVVEPVTRSVALDGFRLGMTADEVRGRAAHENYVVEQPQADRLVVWRANQRVEIFIGKTGGAREIVQALEDRTNLENEKALVLRFGFRRDLWPLRPGDLTYKNWDKVAWSSADETVAVEFHPKTKFGDPPTLHLIDLKE